MKKLLYIALIAIFTVNNAHAQDKKAKPFKIGVADLGVLFDKYHRKADLEKEINGLKKEYDKRIRDVTKLIRTLDRESEDCAGRRLRNLQDRLALEIERRRIMKARMEDDLRRVLRSMTTRLLDEINSEIRRYGKEQGYTMIFKVDNQRGDLEESRDKIFRAQVQAIPYFDESLDITAAVLARLNAKKKAPEKKKKM